jgi:dihydrosphingosine 1-phosphate phosphatase
MLAAGVFISGFIKDMLCLPRPLSPPLQRITMSGSAALEYGFPSTHSTNAISVIIYWLYLLREDPSPSTTNLALQGIAYCYAFSIVLGRLYCGMHGFFDVVWGSALGWLIGWAQCAYGDAFDQWLLNGDMKRVVIVELLILVLIRIHPEPADDCPCFDDSVSFAGVIMGIQIGGWHFARTQYANPIPTPGTVKFNLASMGWIVAILRVIVGVLMIFAWRAIAKPTLLKLLPPIFRFIENYGMTLPRRFFTPASQYTTVPHQKDDDNVLPHARNIPEMFSNLRRRNRAISIGPQSEADAYEALAYREKRRRDSRNATADPSPVLRPQKSFPSRSSANGAIQGNRKRSSSLEQFKAQMGMAPPSPTAAESPVESPMSGEAQINELKLDDVPEGDLFANLQRPRVRYDVEVVTRLIVYAGIGWIAVEWNPILFHMIGLGMK